MRLVLVSASPRRADLLRAAGFRFDVLPVAVDEAPLDGEAAGDYVRRLASEKARAAEPLAGADDVLVGADTTVVLEGRILGKPADEAEARVMVGSLAGRTHEVLTAVAVRRAGQERTGTERTLVAFAPMSPAEITWYAASGEPHDKAGGYGIQGLASRFIDRIEGSYGNVVGLPVALVVRLLRELAPELLL